jgi:two-component system response regulator CpxR
VRRRMQKPSLQNNRSSVLSPFQSDRMTLLDKTRTSREQNECVSSPHLPSTQVSPSHLLLIDDDLPLAKLIAEYCEPLGLSVASAATGEEGVYQSQQKRFLLIILDVMLPGMDGFEVLKRIRQRSNTPVLMLTTRGATRDRVQGLQSGADDYLPKPFQPEELIARVQSILRRAYPKPRAVRLVAGDLDLDESRRSVTQGGNPIELTGAEFELLRLLMEQPGTPLAREELVPQIFDRDAQGLDRSIDNLASNLRRKLGQYPDGSERIKSVRNVGYTYVAERGR